MFHLAGFIEEHQALGEASTWSFAKKEPIFWKRLGGSRTFLCVRLVGEAGRRDLQRFQETSGHFHDVAAGRLMPVDFRRSTIRLWMF